MSTVKLEQVSVTLDMPGGGYISAFTYESHLDNLRPALVAKLENDYKLGTINPHEIVYNSNKAVVSMKFSRNF
jgi:hypothetical protein